MSPRRWFPRTCLVSLAVLSACLPPPGQRAQNASPARSGEPEGRIFDNLRSRSAHDLGCASESLHISDLGGGSYGVSGCNKRATYVLVRGYPSGIRRWVLNNVSDDGTGQISNGNGANGSSAVVTTRDKDGRPVLNYSLPVTTVPNMTLKLLAQPVSHPDSVLLAFQRQSLTETLKTCDVKVVANGELLQLPPSKYEGVTQGREHVAIEMPVSSFATLAQAERVIAQVCTSRVELGGNDLAPFRDFLLRFREEQVLAGQVAPSQEPVPEHTSL